MTTAVRASIPQRHPSQWSNDANPWAHPPRSSSSTTSAQKRAIAADMFPQSTASSSSSTSVAKSFMPSS